MTDEDGPATGGITVTGRTTADELGGRVEVGVDPEFRTGPRVDGGVPVRRGRRAGRAGGLARGWRARRGPRCRPVVRARGGARGRRRRSGPPARRGEPEVPGMIPRLRSKAALRPVTPIAGTDGDGTAHPGDGSGDRADGTGGWSGRFTDRADAGWRLAERLERFRSAGPVVLGLPRGGVPVAYQVATALDAPLDVIVVRKLGVPFQPELAMGAIGEGGVARPRRRGPRSHGRGDRGRTRGGRAPASGSELAARVERYRRGRERVDLTGRTAIVVDDGVATGLDRAGGVPDRPGAGRGVGGPGRAGRAGGDAPARVEDADEVVACRAARAASGPSATTTATSRRRRDDEVIVLLDRAARRRRDEHRPTEPPDVRRRRRDPGRRRRARGSPPPARAGTGRGRVRPRQRQQPPQPAQPVRGRRALRRRPRHAPPRPAHAGRGARPRATCSTSSLAGRPAGRGATAWLAAAPDAAGCRIGYFGASTGAGGRAVGGGRPPRTPVAAVVSRGGRPDLAARPAGRGDGPDAADRGR